MRRRIFVTNVFGNKNKGDQVLFESLRAAVRAQCGDVVWAVATNPTDNARIYPDVEWFGVPWYTHRRGRLGKVAHAAWSVGTLPLLAALRIGRSGKLIAALGEADVVIACPGGYLEDSSPSYISHTLQLLLVALLGKRLILAPQSVGPVASPLWRGILRYIFLRASHIYVREEWSYRFCATDLRIPPDRLSLTVDLAIHVPFKLEGRQFQLRRQPGGRCLGLTVLDWGFQGREDAKSRYRDEIIALAERFHRRGWRIKMLPQTFSRDAPNPDLEFASAILDACPFIESAAQPEHLSDFLRQFENVTVTVGSRLHSCLLSIVAGVPAIALAYLPKSIGTFELMGIEDHAYGIDRFSAEELEAPIHLLANDDEAEVYFRRINASLNERGTEFRF